MYKGVMKSAIDAFTERSVNVSKYAVRDFMPVVRSEPGGNYDYRIDIYCTYVVIAYLTYG